MKIAALIAIVTIVETLVWNVVTRRTAKALRQKSIEEGVNSERERCARLIEDPRAVPCGGFRYKDRQKFVELIRNGQ